MVAAALVVCGLPAPASTVAPDRALSELGIASFGRVDGLPQTGITALATTVDGFLWVGTQAGLARFDGASFKVFDKFNTPELKDHFITSLMAARTGELWIGTQSGLIRRERDGSLQRFAKEDGLSNDYVRALWEDSQGRLWAGTYGGGVVRWTGTGFHPVSDQLGLSEQVVRALRGDRNGTLWIGTSRGLYRYQEGEVGLLGADDGMTSDFIRSIAGAADGGLWIGVQGAGLLHWDGLKISNHTRRLGIPADATVWSMCTDRRGSLWVGTRGHGLLRVTEHGVDRLTTADGLASNVVWSLHEDPEGNLWVGTRSGLNQIKETVITSFTTEHGLADDFVLTVYEDRSGGLWVGTNDGIAHFAGAQVSAIGRQEGLGVDLVFQILEDDAGFLWLSTRRGLLRVAREALARRAAGEQVALSVQLYDEANLELERLATTDDLTGIKNHRTFRTTLDEEWRRHLRSRQNLSLIILDVDYFKGYNDRYGHLRGDRALRAVARTFSAHVTRAADLAARYGGEEFVAVLAETDLDGAEKVAERVRKAVAALGIRHEASEVAVHLTVSLGVACLRPRAEASPDDLVAAADAALYEAKNGGRNRVCSSDRVAAFGESDPGI